MRSPTVAAARDFISTVLQDTWWQERFRHALEIRVKGSGTARSTAVPGWHEPWIKRDGLQHTIYLPPWSRRTLVILHELAHAAQPHRTNSHGGEFVRIWIDLVERHMGRTTAAQLRAALRSERISWASRPAVSNAQQRANAYVGQFVDMLNNSRPGWIPGETWGERFERAYRRAKQAHRSAGEPPLNYARLVALAQSAVPEARTHHVTLLKRLQGRPLDPLLRRIAYAFLIVMGYGPETAEDMHFGLTEADRVTVQPPGSVEARSKPAADGITIDAESS